jgi:hypothetical protein
VSDKTSELVIALENCAREYTRRLIYESPEQQVAAANEMHAARAALLSRIRELEADAARLDWVAEHLYASVSHGDDSFTIDWYDEEGYEQHTRMPAFREAIDAARSPESKTEGAKP